jgi:hypothetical protein
VAIAASQGGRTARYGGFDDAWVTAQDATTQVYHGADPVVLIDDHTALVAGFGAALTETRAMAESAPVSTKP